MHVAQQHLISSIFPSGNYVHDEKHMHHVMQFEMFHRSLICFYSVLDVNSCGICYQFGNDSAGATK